MDKRIENNRGHSWGYRVCSGISYTMLILYFLDIILLGTGNLTRVGSLSTRILFFGMAGIFSLPLLLCNIRQLLKNKYVICTALFILCVVINAFRGFGNGNRVDIIRSDFFGYLNFCLLPTMFCVLNTWKRKLVLIKTIIVACVFAALAAITLSFFVFIPNNEEFYLWLNDSGLCGITVMDGIATRVFFHTSSRYFLVAFILSMVLLHDSTCWKKNIMYILAMALLILGVFFSYARALYAGSVIAVCVVFLLMLLYRDKKYKRVFLGAIASVSIAVLMLCVVGFIQKTNLFENAIYRVALSFVVPPETIPVTEPTVPTTEPTVPTTEPTVPTTEPTGGNQFVNEEQERFGLFARNEKIRLLLQSIEQNPVFGNGLGAAIDYDGGYVEYTYHDIVNKMGAVGMLLFLSTFLLFTGDIFINKKQNGDLNCVSDGMYKIAAYAIIIYFLFITYFNPCMNTTVGISAYLLCITLAGPRERETEI